MAKVNLTEAQTILRNHFDKECGSRKLQVFEVLSGVGIPEHGLWEFHCKVKCFLANDVRNVVGRINSQDGSMLSVKEQSREPYKP